jgi:hypothetical protein
VAEFFNLFNSANVSQINPEKRAKPQTFLQMKLTFGEVVYAEIGVRAYQETSGRNSRD